MLDEAVLRAWGIVSEPGLRDCSRVEVDDGVVQDGAAPARLPTSPNEDVIVAVFGRYVAAGGGVAVPHNVS